jgi:hypothetical protein
MRGAREGGWLGWYVGAYLVFLYLPVALIPLFSFNDAVQAAFPLKGFTLAWYKTLAGNETLTSALLTSLTIGLMAAGAADFRGCPLADPHSRRGHRHCASDPHQSLRPWAFALGHRHRPCAGGAADHCDHHARAVLVDPEKHCRSG